MSDCKPFKTIDEQIALLKSRGIVFIDEKEAASFLLNESYYSVINGYKDAFLDKQATDLAGDDRYPDDLPFEYFELLYLFDELLRRISMNALLSAESTMKTTVAYAFCYAHRDHDAYLDPSSYCSKSEYHDERNYTRGLIHLLSALQAVRDNKHHKEYVSHYVKSHHCLPLWVASKCLTFGNISSFFDFQKKSVKTRTCVAMAEALRVPSVREKDLTYAFRTLPSFRNICAHNERLYCAGVGKNGEKHFPELLRALSYVTPVDKMSGYASQVLKQLKYIKKGQPKLHQKILDGMHATESDISRYIVE